MNIKISPASQEHIDGIFDLVMELAIYEKASHEVWLNAEDYHRLFREEAFESIVALNEDRVVGTCIFYDTFSTWKGRMLYLEDFVVQQDFRQYGIGQKLFDEFVRIAKKRSCALIKWQVLDWNEPALAFYRKNKAIIESEWWNCKVLFEKPN